MITEEAQSKLAQALLSPKQRWSIRNSNARINIWDGSVRSGKSVGTYYRWIQSIGFDDSVYDSVMVGKTVGALKRNVINPILDLLGDNASYHPGKQEMHIFNKVCHIIGASDERSEGKIRGMTVKKAYGDEITLWPQSFFTMLLSRLSVPGAQFFGTTNPDNPKHWLKKTYLDRVNELDLKRFHFKLDDNPFLDPAYVESLKKEYVGLWYKRFILGEWCVAEGAIYDFFDENLHTINHFPDALYYDAGIDYGTTNPCVFLIFGVNPYGKPKIWCEREYYYDPAKKNRQQTDVEFSNDFRQFIDPFKPKLRNIYVDPSAASLKLQLKRDGVFGIKDDIEDTCNDVLDGIRTVARMLKNGEYAIHRSCRNYIDEMYSYVWNPKKQLVGEDVPMKVNDHAQDCGRYVIHSKFGSKSNYDINKLIH